jgi:branched-chain amino acid transport system substrate-binding protein
MSSPSSDDENSDYGRYAPRRLREQPPMPAAKPFYVATKSPSSSPTEDPDRRELAPLAEQVPGPAWRQRSGATPVGRVAAVTAFAALVALLTILAKPLWQQDEQPQLNIGNTKTSDRVTATNTLANSTPLTTTGSVAVPAAAPTANAQAQQLAIPAGAGAASVAVNPGTVPAAGTSVQQASLSPNPQEPRKTFRGVTDGEIRFGISAPFSGAAKELGQNMRLGIEAAFRLANASGGVFGRQLRLIAADDGYEPTRTAITMKDLYEKDQVFGLVGNVGTPTAVVGLPYALDRKMLFFGAFTGAGLLRSDPPDRYVFNYRASYTEETEAVVNYLVKVKRLKPEQIAVFAQQDAYGDSGFAGVTKAIRALGGNTGTILRLNYQRNTVDVDDAVAHLNAEQQLRLTRKRPPIKAVIMVPAYRAAAKFIEKTRDFYPDMIYTSVSFVGSTALANELTLLGKRFANGVIVTQVVPALDGHSSLVLDYKSALSKYFPGEAPDYVSLEGYVAANVLIAALKRNGAELDTEKLVATLENLRDLDIGLGTPITFGRSEHQAVHKVWGTQLDETGHFQPIDLQ